MGKVVRTLHAVLSEYSTVQDTEDRGVKGVASACNIRMQQAHTGIQRCVVCSGPGGWL